MQRGLHSPSHPRDMGIQKNYIEPETGGFDKAMRGKKKK